MNGPSSLVHLSSALWYVLPCPMGLLGNAGCSGRNQEIVRKEGRLLDIVRETDTAGG